MKKLYSSLILLGALLLSAASIAQTVSGKVYDSANQTLPGVVVKDKQSGNGVATDIDGNFTLNLSAGKHTLEFVLIGYLNQSKDINLTEGQKLALNVTMQEDEKMAEEVVVVGYGVQRKRDVTGSITRIDGKELTQVPVPSFEAALARVRWYASEVSAPSRPEAIHSMWWTVFQLPKTRSCVVTRER
jgi:hypothetical protein